MSDSGPEPIPVDFTEDDATLESIFAAKREMRRSVRKKIASMPMDERYAASKTVVDTVMDLPELRSAKCVAMYWATPDEVDLGELAEHCLSTGKDILLPVTNTRKRTMRFVSIEDPARDLKQGPIAGIMEPRRGLPLADITNLDVIVCPGRSFDGSGARLGRGDGYYDGFLAGIKPHEMGGLMKVGVGFGCQLADEVPTTIRDVDMDLVVTERGLIDPGKA